MLDLSGINSNNFLYKTHDNEYNQKLRTYTELPDVYIPPAPPENGASVQIYDVQKNVYINVIPEDSGNVVVDIISPQNNEVIDHYSIDTHQVKVSNASCVEMLALEEYLVKQNQCDQILIDYIMHLYENDALDKKCNYTNELRNAVDSFGKYNSFDLYMKYIQATNAILNWKV